MLLEASAAAFVLAPRGFRPGFGASQPPSRAARFVLLWECFRIYFSPASRRSQAAIRAGAISRRWTTITKTVRSDVDQLVDAAAAARDFTSLPRARRSRSSSSSLRHLGDRATLRLATFAILTSLQLGIIATANYCFLNHLVLALSGIFLVDDDALRRVRLRIPRVESVDAVFEVAPRIVGRVAFAAFLFVDCRLRVCGRAWIQWRTARRRLPKVLRASSVSLNRYGLFARMTNVRYEIELEGSEDGTTWRTYALCVQAPRWMKRRKSSAPYQPRFWNGTRGFARSTKRTFGAADEARRARDVPVGRLSKRVCSRAHPTCSRSSATIHSASSPAFRPRDALPILDDRHRATSGKPATTGDVNASESYRPSSTRRRRSDLRRRKLGPSARTSYGPMQPRRAFRKIRSHRLRRSFASTISASSETRARFGSEMERGNARRDTRTRAHRRRHRRRVQTAVEQSFRRRARSRCTRHSWSPPWRSWSLPRHRALRDERRRPSPSLGMSPRPPRAGNLLRDPAHGIIQRLAPTRP